MAPPRDLLGIMEIAAAFRVTRETIRLWRVAGMPERTVSGRPMFALHECIQWRLERAQAEAAQRPEEELDRDREQARKLAAEASLAELKLATQRNELIPAQQYRDELERVVGGFASAAMGQLQRFERDIIAAATPADARRLVERMQDALMAGAQAYADDLDDAPVDDMDEVAA